MERTEHEATEMEHAADDLVEETAPATRKEPPRKRYELDDRGFDEVPKKYRKFYRRWEGPDDELAPNEAFCPVCKIVVRSVRELREGDRVYCMACMTRLTIVRGENGRLEARVVY
jgi:hypothetical protein